MSNNILSFTVIVLFLVIVNIPPIETQMTLTNNGKDKVTRLMKTVIKAIIATAIIATSYTASARDGAFTGNVNLNNQANNSVVASHYAVNGTADKSHSGIVVMNKNSHMSFNEKLLSAADK